MPKYFQLGDELHSEAQAPAHLCCLTNHLTTRNQMLSVCPFSKSTFPPSSGPIIVNKCSWCKSSWTHREWKARKYKGTRRPASQDCYLKVSVCRVMRLCLVGTEQKECSWSTCPMSRYYCKPLKWVPSIYWLPVWWGKRRHTASSMPWPRGHMCPSCSESICQNSSHGPSWISKKLQKPDICKHCICHTVLIWFVQT